MPLKEDVYVFRMFVFLHSRTKNLWTDGWRPNFWFGWRRCWQFLLKKKINLNIFFIYIYLNIPHNMLFIWIRNGWKPSVLIQIEMWHHLGLFRKLTVSWKEKKGRSTRWSWRSVGGGAGVCRWRWAVRNSPSPPWAKPTATGCNRSQAKRSRRQHWWRVPLCAQKMNC